MVTTGIRNKTVFLEVECPDSVTCGKVLALVDFWVDGLKKSKEKGDGSD
jgi:hypothetical protein